jgi:flagella basal body P-ring formation protein FlgA
MKLLFHLVVGLSFATTGAIALEPAPSLKATLKLAEMASVQNDTILLSDVVAVPVDAELAGVAIGPAPTIGKSLVLQRKDIDSYLHKLQPQFPYTWEGAQKCTISFPATELTEKQVADLIETALWNFANKEGEVRVIKVLNYSTTLIPKSQSITNVELVSPNARSAFGSVSLNVEHQGRPFARRTIRFEWDWKKPVWIATDSQLAGRIQDTDFALENRSVLTLQSEAVPSKILPKELLLLRPIVKGEPLLVSNIKTPIAVARGSAVTAKIQAGALMVSMKAVALENGIIGQTIHLQNPTSRKELLGRVIQENAVEVIP